MASRLYQLFRAAGGASISVASLSTVAHTAHLGNIDDFFRPYQYIARISLSLGFMSALHWGSWGSHVSESMVDRKPPKADTGSGGLRTFHGGTDLLRTPSRAGGLTAA